MIPALGTYAVTLIAFLAIDAVWLAVMVPAFYKPRMLTLMADKPNLVAGVAFYLLYALGVTVLVVWPNLAAGDLGRVFLLGALLGLVAYGTYDLTNLATLKDWPLTVTVVDLIWGAVLSGSVSTVAVWVARRFV